jgi:hypothetical protein
VAAFFAAFDEARSPESMKFPVFGRKWDQNLSYPMRMVAEEPFHFLSAAKMKRLRLKLSDEVPAGALQMIDAERQSKRARNYQNKTRRGRLWRFTHWGIT